MAVFSLIMIALCVRSFLIFSLSFLSLSFSLLSNICYACPLHVNILPNLFFFLLFIFIFFFFAHHQLLYINKFGANPIIPPHLILSPHFYFIFIFYILFPSLGTWFFLWANGIFTFFSFLLFFAACYTGDPNQIFMWCSR